MPVINDVSKEFDYARKRAAQNEATQSQGQLDALKRRGAQLGGGPSGALMKQENLAREASARRLADANEQIDTAQRGEVRRIGEVQEGRDFTRAEREASQGFARGEREATHAFARGEREAGQGFSSEQAALMRRFQTGEREAGQTFAQGERVGSQNFASREASLGRNFTQEQNRLARALQSSQFAKQMDLSYDQFKHQQFVDDFNMEMAEKMFNDKDAIERLLGLAAPGEGNIFSQLGNSPLGKSILTTTGLPKPSFGGGGGGLF
jgi:hypothetical protein